MPLGNRRPIRHLPPTAVPVKGGDLKSGLAATLKPHDALAHFRSLLLEQTGGSDCYLVSSGRAALALILLSLKRLSDRSRVVVPAYGCPAVVQSVLAAGLEPVLCDVSPQTLDLAREALDGLVSHDLLAVIPTHLYGLAQDVSDLIATGKEHGIFVIEDAAQAYGARLDGQMVGSLGDAGFYSLGRGKCIPTGHGGVIVAQGHLEAALSATLGELIPRGTKRGVGSLSLFLAYGMATRPAGWWFIVRSPLNPADAGMDAKALPPITLDKLTAAQAGIGASLLGRLDRIHAIQRRNAQRMMDQLAGFGFVTLPEPAAGAEPVFLRLPVVLDSKSRADMLFDHLWREGIGVSRSYYRTQADLFPDQFCAGRHKLPGASRLANCLLTLPTHSYLQEEDLGRIVMAFRTVQ